jgi:hypothetical protein
MKKTCSATRYNAQLISQLLTCILSYNVDICAFFRHYSVFSCTPKCPGSYLWVYTYPRLGITCLTQHKLHVFHPAYCKNTTCFGLTGTITSYTNTKILTWGRYLANINLEKGPLFFPHWCHVQKCHTIKSTCKKLKIL